jgi:hypothetical protein
MSVVRSYLTLRASAPSAPVPDTKRAGVACSAFHIAAVLMLIAGCAAAPTEPSAPPPLPTLLLAERAAVPCVAPRRPAVSDGKDFKYGCFCGKSHPAYGPATTAGLAAMPRAELDALVHKYFELKPYDDLDAACQAHDVCYLINRGARRTCDQVFASRMAKLWFGFSDESGQRRRNPSALLHINPMASRCSEIAMHLTLAHYFFEGTSESPAYELSSGVINLLFGGAAVALAGTTLALASYPDPAAGERCDSVENLASKLPGAVLSQ